MNEYEKASSKKVIKLCSLTLSQIKQKIFNRHCSEMFSMLKGCMEGLNCSYTIRFCDSQFKHKNIVFTFFD